MLTQRQMAALIPYERCFVLASSILSLANENRKGYIRDKDQEMEPH